ncbi:MAG: hypothetical protein R2867_15980 [Caldilineaceae bacterium]
MAKSIRAGRRKFYKGQPKEWLQMSSVSGHKAVSLPANEQMTQAESALLRSLSGMTQSKLPSNQRVTLAAVMGQTYGNTSLQRAILVRDGTFRDDTNRSMRHMNHTVPRFRNVRRNKQVGASQRQAHSKSQPELGIQAIQRDPLLSEAQIQSAIRYNNQKWRGAYRSQILTYLRHGPVDHAEQFTTADVLQVAGMQKASDPDGVDGKIGDTTAASMLQTGMELTSTMKLNPRQVELVFYPGELRISVPGKQPIRKVAEL